MKTKIIFKKITLELGRFPSMDVYVCHFIPREPCVNQPGHINAIFSFIITNELKYLLTCKEYMKGTLVHMYMNLIFFHI